MARLLRCKKVIIDGEIHFADAICGCGAIHDAEENCNYHNLDFEKEVYLPLNYCPRA